MEIQYLKEVGTLNIDETKIKKCFVKEDYILRLEFSGYMTLAPSNFMLHKNTEYSYVIKEGKRIDERYGWINEGLRDDNSVVCILVTDTLWHVISMKEFKDNFNTSAEFRENRIDKILN